MPFTFISSGEQIEPYMKEKSGPIGVLFFGSMNTRRHNIMEHLKKSARGRYEIVTGASFFGEELCEMVKRSKIILNLHFRPKNSLLETCRIHDCLTFGNAHIISEEPASDENETRERYANVVEYIPVIKNDLSNIKVLENKINSLIGKTWTDSERVQRENEIRKIEDFTNNQSNILQCYRYPHLFHKYLLRISRPDEAISFSIERENEEVKYVSNKRFAHLHCYDISMFSTIYGEYMAKIQKYFSVVVTYSEGDYDKVDAKLLADITLLKIPNRGMDIGAKFCMVHYLKEKGFSYEYILFLHSKSNPTTRAKYFTPLLDAIDDTFIENIKDYDGYFPDIQWEIQGEKITRVSGNSHFGDSTLPERNLLYRGELLKYLDCTNKTNRFVEGNVYILAKNIVTKLFTDQRLYNILNRPNDFDYNWIAHRYDLNDDIYHVYRESISRRLERKDKYSFDGYIEHVFERVVLNLCDKGLFYPIKVKKVLSTLSQFNATAFSYVLGKFIRIHDALYSDNFKELYHKLKNIKTTKKVNRIFCSNGLGDFITTSNIINLNDYDTIYIASPRVKIIQKYINNYYPNLKVINIDDGETYFSMSQWLHIHKSNKHYHTILNDCVDISIRIIFKMIDFYYTILDKNPWISDNTISYNHPAFNEMRYISNDLNFINKDEVYDINKISNILKIKKYPIDLKRFNLENFSDYYIIVPYAADDAIDCPKCAHIHKKVDYCSYYRNFTQDDWIGVENYLLKKKMKGIILGVEDGFFPNNKIFLNLTNKTNLFESIELLRKAEGYIGIDSWLCIIAPMFEVSDIKIKSINTNLLLNYRCYFEGDTFIKKYRYNNFETLGDTKTITIMTAQGVGDTLWVYQKLSPYFDIINIIVMGISDDIVQKRSLPFLKCLPKINKISYKIVSSEYYQSVVDLKKGMADVISEWNFNNNAIIKYAMNSWLESEKTLKGCDGYDFEETVNISKTNIDLPFNEYIILYISGNKLTHEWKPKKYCDLILNTYKKYNIHFPVILLGAKYDLPPLLEAETILNSYNIDTHKFIQLPFEKTNYVIANAKYFIGYQSGLCILADQFDIPQTMLYFNYLSKVMYSWPKQKNIKNNIYKSYLFKTDLKYIENFEKSITKPSITVYEASK